MLQQTQVATVVPYYESFMAAYPNATALANANLQDVLKRWEGLGYYARARNLHAAARRLTDERGGEMPRDYDGIRELNGAGDYIAAAVASIAFGERRAVVDGNVKRVLARLCDIEDPVGTAAAARRFREEADRFLDPSRPGDFNQAMMELGARVCRPRAPRCDACPVLTHCAAALSGRQAQLPVRKPKKPVPTYRIAVGVVEREGKLLITRRRDDGLLGGLWEFPGGKIAPGERAEDACVREIREEVGLDVAVTEHLAHVKHAYSHFRIGADVFACRYRAGDVILHGPTDYRWIVVDEIDEYPFPGANHKFLPIVKERLKSHPSR